MLEALRVAAHAGRPYDVALVDPGSSYIEGDELQRILDSDGSLPAIRLVRVTNESAQPDRTVASFASSVTNPPSATALSNAIVEALDGQPSEPAVSSRYPLEQQRAARTTRRVLVAESDAVDQLVMVRMLENLAYDVDRAATGRQAVDMHTQAPYDVILMDCRLTHVGAHQATSEIRELDADARHTQIIALTTDAMPEERKLCLAAGMDFYRTKPLDTGALDEMTAEAFGSINNERTRAEF
jgi:CheY-like chemotaxis protein